MSLRSARHAHGPVGGGEVDRQRIDKWLWHARVVRSRGDAAALVEAGHARVNGRRVTAPGHAVRIGDVVTLALDRGVRVLEIAGFCERRGRAADAAATCRDLSGRPPPQA